MTALPFGRGLGVVTLLSVVMVEVVGMMLMRVHRNPFIAGGAAVGAVLGVQVN